MIASRVEIIRTKANGARDEEPSSLRRAFSRVNSINIITQLLYILKAALSSKSTNNEPLRNCFMLRIWSVCWARAQTQSMLDAFFFVIRIVPITIKRLFCLFMRESCRFMMPNFENYLLLIANFQTLVFIWTKPLIDRLDVFDLIKWFVRRLRGISRTIWFAMLPDNDKCGASSWERSGINDLIVYKRFKKSGL